MRERCCLKRSLVRTCEFHTYNCCDGTFRSVLVRGPVLLHVCGPARVVQQLYGSRMYSSLRAPRNAPKGHWCEIWQPLPIPKSLRICVRNFCVTLVKLVAWLLNSMNLACASAPPAMRVSWQHRTSSVCSSVCSSLSF